MQQRRKPGPKPSVTLVEAMCDECGNIRTAKDTYLGRSGCPGRSAAMRATAPPIMSG